MGRWYPVRCPTAQGGCDRRQPQDLQEGSSAYGPCRRCGKILEAQVVAGQVYMQIVGPKRQHVPGGTVRYFETEELPKSKQLQ